MKRIITYLLGIFIVLIAPYACTETDYTMGDLTAPSDIVINTEVVGADASNLDGDGSGVVNISVTAKNALSYKIDYDANTPLDLVNVPSGIISKKFTTLGVNTYRITVVAIGKGGTSSTATKEVTVRSDFLVNPDIVADLTGGSSKTWKVDKSLPGQFGVGPWDASSVGPDWWSAAVNEKVSCCNCFYTATFTFSIDEASNGYSIQVATPDGVLTKTGSLTTLPGIPESGSEGCYGYPGGTSAFSFIPASSGVAASAPSTQTSILLSGNTTFIGYGSLLKEYEIMELTDSYLYLRAQGTETGNAWYLKLTPQ